MRKLASFVVCCYNSQEYMRKCIDSLLLGGERVEIIIIDDGSKDDTGKIADEYLEKYPTIIKVVHQENGGHGAGVSRGIQEATGYYFKVVDSDDWVDAEALEKFLDFIEKSDKTVDCIVTDYQYFYKGEPSERISYGSVFPEYKPCSIEETKKFKVDSYLTIHSVSYRVDFLHSLNLQIPRKTFYDDNYFIYIPLCHIKKYCYLPVRLYCYFVGRAGQSVSKEFAIKRYGDYMKIDKACFMEVDQMKYKGQKKLFKLLSHQYFIIHIEAMMYAQLSNTKESRQALKDFRAEAKKANPKQYRKYRHLRYAGFVSLPNFIGHLGGKFSYWVSHLFVKYN